MIPPPAPRFKNGAGNPLLLLHAGWTSWHIWTPILDRLSRERDVLAPTMLGHFGGPVATPQHPPTLENVITHILSEMDAAGFDCPDIVGNSIGGYLALDLARRGRARSVVALCPEGKQTTAQALSVAARALLAHRAVRSLGPVLRRALTAPSFRKLLVRDFSARGHLIPVELVEQLMRSFAYCDVLRTLTSNRKGFLAVPTIGDVSDIKCPVYFIWGIQDTLVLKDEMARYRADLPTAKFLAVDDCGHCPQLDWPELIATEILSFTGPAEAPRSGAEPVVLTA
jgi:pimeloyl-ACP methyl ester carboxylesterase